MSAEPTAASIEHGGFTITTNASTPEAMKTALTPPEAVKETEEKPDLSRAASELGKKGGEAAAAKRAAEAKEKAKEEKAAKAAEVEAKPDEKADEEKPLGKPRDDPRARMLEATRQAAEAKRERDAIRAEKDRLAAELAEARKPAEEKPKAGEDPEPQEADFSDYKDFVKASARWEARQIVKEERRQAEEDRHIADLDNQVTADLRTFYGRLTEAAKSDPSFKERTFEFIGSLQPTVMLEPGKKPGPFNDISNWILDSKQAPALALHFSEHRDDFQRIATLKTPQEVLREMAKLEVKLEKGVEAATAGVSSRPEVSKANPPVRPVTGSPHIAGEQGYRPGMSLDDYSQTWKPAKR